jgi:hypothetical protein
MGVRRVPVFARQVLVCTVGGRVAVVAFGKMEKHSSKLQLRYSIRIHRSLC